MTIKIANDLGPCGTCLVDDAEDHSVNESNGSHSNQTEQEQVGVSVQLKVCGFRVKDGAHQLPLLRTEACAKQTSTHGLHKESKALHSAYH